MKAATICTVVLSVVICAFAATRDSYRNAYRVWRELDPTLERDAGSVGISLAPRAEKMATPAAQYFSERANFLKTQAADRQSHTAWLESSGPEPLVEVPKSVADHVAAEVSAVRRNMATFANDPDRGIQRLQGVLQQENVALTALTAAIAERQKAFDDVKAATEATIQARAKLLGQERELIAALEQAAADADRQKSAWVEYYKALSDEARGISPLPTPPPAPPPPTPTVTPTIAAASEIKAPAAPVARTPTITPVPLLRYTGEWIYPSDGLFHGAQPASVELTVNEENGHAEGTFSGHFKIPPGSKDDPVLRFKFNGDFQSTRNQLFALETSDGAKGTIELIPGPAFNLLEINFQIDPKPGKIHRANAVLVKK